MEELGTETRELTELLNKTVSDFSASFTPKVSETSEKSSNFSVPAMVAPIGIGVFIIAIAVVLVVVFSRKNKTVITEKKDGSSKPSYIYQY